MDARDAFLTWFDVDLRFETGEEPRLIDEKVSVTALVEAESDTGFGGEELTSSSMSSSSSETGSSVNTSNANHSGSKSAGNRQVWFSLLGRLFGAGDPAETSGSTLPLVGDDGKSSKVSFLAALTSIILLGGTAFGSRLRSRMGLLGSPSAPMFSIFPVSA